MRPSAYVTRPAPTGGESVRQVVRSDEGPCTYSIKASTPGAGPRTSRQGARRGSLYAVRDPAELERPDEAFDR